MAKDSKPKVNGKSKEKKTKVQKELKPISEAQVKMLASMPFLIPLLYSKQQPPGLNLSLAKYAKTRTLPKVNLLPPIVALMVKDRRVKFGLFLAALCSTIIALMIWAITGVAINQAHKDLSNLNSQVADSQNRVNGLTPYKTYLDSIRTSIQGANKKLGVQLDYGKLLSDLQRESSGGNSVLLNITMKYIDPTLASTASKGTTATLASQCGPVNNPFASETVPLVACIAFSGNISDRSAIPSLIQKLSALPYLKDVSIIQASQTVAGQETPFSGTAAITKALVLPLTGGIR